MMGSVNHSLTQARLTRLLGNLDKYEVFTELSIEIDKVEYKPDVCLYPKLKINYLKDNVKMLEMPLLAIEVISPSQYIQDLVNKVEVYFNAGIKSCWIATPIYKSITVFSNFENFEVFSKGNVIDNILGIELSINEIFK